MSFKHNCLRKDFHKAFTLAEVLITLGIIGIVVAMTLPTLIERHNKNVVETRLQKFYSSMNQAIKMAELDYGERGVWFEDNKDQTKQKEWVNKYLVPYLNVLKVSNLPYGNLTTIYFADGSAVSMVKNNGRDWWFFPGDPEKCITFGNNQYWKFVGRCAFSFYYNPVQSGSTYQYFFEPYDDAWDKTENSLKYKQSTGCYVDNNDQQWPGYCTKLIQYHGWKFPKDYKYKVFFR